MKRLAGHERAVDVAATGLAIVAALQLVGHLYRAATSEFDVEHFPWWQRPWVDGASTDSSVLAACALVLLLVFPGLQLARVIGAPLLVATTALNAVTGVGYLIASSTFEDTPSVHWSRPELDSILIYDLPTYGVAVIVFITCVNARLWERKPVGGRSPAEQT